MWRRLVRRSTLATAGAAIVGLVIVAALAAPILATTDPIDQDLSAALKPPFWREGGSLEHPLGTDHLGRDMLSRLIFGARVSMIVGFFAVIVAGVIGTALGIISGYFGGWVDQVIMRITDTWLAFPALIFAIFLAAILGPSLTNIVIILGAVYFATAYLLLGSVFLAIGSMAATVRDVQTLSFPVTMLQLIVFLFSTYAATQTGRPAALAAMVIPFTSPFAMLARGATDGALWPHLAAIAWQALWVAVCVRTGATLFRRRVMKSGGGGRPRRRGLLRRLLRNTRA